MPLGTLGKYERLDVLGHGISGIVYLARDTLLNKQVAIKEVDVQAGDVSRFLEEARVMDRLRHPNIVRVNGVDRIEGHVVIDMEYVRGPNLQQLLREQGVLPPDEGVRIAIAVLDALAYAHAMQTVHRDIKPANILIGRNGDVKLVDFGLAEILSTNAYAGGAGTYAYMAPEDFASEDRSDQQSDIWAVGITLFEALTGERPFRVASARDPFAWKRVLETESPARLDELLSAPPPGLQAILDRALAREKQDRYATAAEMRDALQALLPALEQAPAETASAVAAHAGRVATAIPQSYDGRKEAAGVVVADVSRPVPERRRTRPSSWLRRRQAEASLTVQPDSIDFGAVRKGDSTSIKVQARIAGIAQPEGRITHLPGWLTATPAEFKRNRQTVMLTADTTRVWETGEFEDRIRVESPAGVMEVPVRLSVLKPRPAFAQVALWYVPLLLLVLAPVGGVSLLRPSGSAALAAQVLGPPAAAASALLAAMLLLVCAAADSGLVERIVAAVVLCAGLVVCGAAASTVWGHVHAPPHLRLGMQRAGATAGILGMVVLLQILHFRKWRFWAVILAACALIFTAVLLRPLLHAT